MAKVSRATKPREKQTTTEKNTIEKGTQQELKTLPYAEKLMAFSEDATFAASSTSDAAATPAPTPAPARRFSAADAAREASTQVETLVRMPLDSVSSVNRSEEGWNVIVNVVELARIPHSTDVLASYNVSLDGEGNLMSYSRGNRYTRDQTGDGL